MIYKRKNPLNRLIYKGRLYEAIKNRSEEIFETNYLRGYNEPLEKYINDSIDYYWDDILESPDFERVENEDELGDLLVEELLDDLDEEDIIYKLNHKHSYRTMYPKRHYGLR